MRYNVKLFVRIVSEIFDPPEPVFEIGSLVRTAIHVCMHNVFIKGAKAKEGERANANEERGEGEREEEEKLKF